MSSLVVHRKDAQDLHSEKVWQDLRVVQARVDPSKFTVNYHDPRTVAFLLL
jgi:hypothetical protein